MKFNNNSHTWWYGTPDAPAPLDGVIQPRRGNAVVVGVQPPGSENSVAVQYRVDDGPPQTVPAARLTSDFARGTDYFRALLPDFLHGSRVSYLPIVSGIAGAMTGFDPAGAKSSFFRLADRGAAKDEAVASRAELDPQQKYSMDYIGTVRVPLQQPDTIGVTPEGIMVNWFWHPAEGSITGPKLNARVRGIGGDWMTIRRDGVGVMDVRATLETPEGALVFVDYMGHFDLGPNGYEEFLARRWPARAPTRTSPRFHTAHPKYLWLNRIQGIGVGEVRMKELLYIYDLYGVL